MEVDEDGIGVAVVGAVDITQLLLACGLSVGETETTIGCSGAGESTVDTTIAVSSSSSSSSSVVE